jgi:serine/threonine protein kinase
MSSGSEGKPPSGSSPGRPAADTPQRLVVRSLDGDDSHGASDTAVAVATAKAGTSLTDIGRSNTDAMAPLDRPALTEIVGMTLSGRYLVTRKIGQGGMGAVYEATHTLIGKRVAIKVLLEKYAQREAIVARLKKEAQLASSVRNEHIIEITDFGTTEDGRTFVVMEYLEGESLAECLARESKLPEQRILRIASQAASALAAAHAMGVVHRDIKPENLFLLRRKDQDFVKVVDFGISKSVRASGEEEEAQPRLTQTGMVLGTPLYMSPEQARGDENLDHRVDVWALGVIMFETATGRVPFAGNNYLSVISQVLNEEPPPLRELRPDLTEEFEAIVLRAMAKERSERYTDANEMLADVNAVLEDPTHSTERAKITGPRRLAQRKVKGVKIAYWLAGISMLITAIVISVVAMNSGGNAKKVVTPPVTQIDGGVVATAPDAALVEPIKTVTFTITSDPPNAEIYRDSERVGIAPVDVPFVLKDKEIVITAQLAGYDEATTSVNPIERASGSKIVQLHLKRPKQGPPKITKMRPAGQGSGSSAQPANHTNGELGNNPFLGSGNVPKK